MLTVTGGALRLVINGVTADSAWVVEDFVGGGGSGGGDVTNILAGAGIDVDAAAAS